MRSLLVLICIGLLGCEETIIFINTPTPTNYCADQDFDGYCSSIDCDDYNNEIYPGAIDICDSYDNDCDKWVNEDCDE